MPDPSARTIRFKVLSSYVIFSVSSFIILGILFIDLYSKRLNENLQGRLDFMLNEIMEHGMHEHDIGWIKQFFHVDHVNHPELTGYISHLAITVRADVPPLEEGHLRSVRHLPGGDAVILSSATDRIDAARNLVVGEIMLVFGVVLLTGAIIFVVYLYSLFRPVDCLVQFCRSFSHERSLLPMCKGSSEIEELKDAIVQLLSTNANLVEQEQVLFKEAAHELKSPLAVLKARLDLLSKGRYDVQTFIKEANEDIDKMTDHLKEMLFLKSVEHVMQGAEQDLDIFQQIEAVIGEFTPLLEKKGLQISYGGKLSFKVRSNAIALNKILKAVGENVIHHSSKKSVIYININPAQRSVDFLNTVIAEKDHEGLFSSHIGLKTIERLSNKLGFECSSRVEGNTFRTTLRFQSAA